MDTIQQLEQWHREWEIQHPEMIVVPTFATEFDLTHKHRWGGWDYSRGHHNAPFRRCWECKATEDQKSGE